MPYRSEKRRPAAQAAPQPGLVTDMVRQFADPYAFLRELVQNSIDAGATSIAARVERSSDGAVRTSVRDDGCGMTPEVIEGALLTLFSSTKEGDATKVGKYGIGFVSVFAIEPEEVIVETWRDGGCWKVTLSPDHSYVLEQLESRAGHGTCVTLVSAMEPSALEQHVDRCRAALERWAGHAEVPIRLACFDEGAPNSAREHVITTPLDIDAVVKLRARFESGEVVVGCSAPTDSPRSFAGFYNRGLTLHTESEPLDGLAGVRFKLNSSSLGHTLSRDNVRRDAAFWALIDRVRELVRGELREEAARRLALAAAGSDPDAYQAALATARCAPLSLERSALSFPLTDPIGGQRAMSGDRIARSTPGRGPILWCPEPDSLTRALSQAGVPVIHCARAAIASEVAEVFCARTLFGTSGFQRSHELWVLIEERKLTAPRRRLVEAIARALAACGQPVARVMLAALRGKTPDRAAVVIGADATPLHWARTLAKAHDLDGSRALVLDIASKPVLAALERAKRDVAGAAQLLARLVLVELRGPLAPRENAALLAAHAQEPE